jgi:hypothetical protein
MHIIEASAKNRAWGSTLGSLGRADTEELSLRLHTNFLDDPDDVTVDASLGVESLNLELVKLDKEFLDELIKEVVALAHKFGCLLLSHLAGLVQFRLLEVRENQDEHSSEVARNLDQVDVSALIIHNLMEIPIEDLPLINNALFVIANLHGWRSLGGDQVEPLTLLMRLLSGIIQRWHGGVAIQSCLLGGKLVVPTRVLLGI